jgi:hypothetical protein
LESLEWFFCIAIASLEKGRSKSVALQHILGNPGLVAS